MEELLTTVGDGVLSLSNEDVPYCIPFGFEEFLQYPIEFQDHPTQVDDFFFGFQQCPQIQHLFFGGVGRHMKPECGFSLEYNIMGLGITYLIKSLALLTNSFNAS